MTLQRHNVNSRLLKPLHDPRFQGHASDPQTIARVAPTQSQPLALTISLGVTCSQFTGLQAGAALPASGSLRTRGSSPCPVSTLCASSSLRFLFLIVEDMALHCCLPSVLGQKEPWAAGVSEGCGAWGSWLPSDLFTGPGLPWGSPSLSSPRRHGVSTSPCGTLSRPMAASNPNPVGPCF